jgi:DNA-directed RNA polymerase specialized sigma24 family protein
VSTVSLEAALKNQDWADLSRRLTRYAKARLRGSSLATAEEIAQQAIMQLLDPAYASWDRERHPDVFDCLGHIVNGLVVNHFRRNARRGKHVTLREDNVTHDDEIEPLGDGEVKQSRTEPDDVQPGDEAPVLPPPDDVHLSDARTPEDLLTQRPLQSRNDEVAMASLRAELGSDSLCLALLERMKSGPTRPAADADALGVTVLEIYAAKRRLLYHARGIARDLAAGGDS